MSSQIFKHKFSRSILFDFLSQNCSNTDWPNDHSKPYIINKETFKKINLNQEILPNFINLIEPYYYISKKHYINKKINLTALFTIIRQICKFLNIKYTSEIKYFKSKYEIIYYIFSEQ